MSARPSRSPSPAELPSAMRIRDEVVDRRRSAVSFVEEAFARAEKMNSMLNALVALRLDRALAEAGELDARIRAGEPVGALAGVPFTVKDVIATEGMATTCGSRAVRGRTTDQDATVVARMRSAGAILIGKTNCSEFAMSIDTVNDRYGRTVNPIGDFTVGGSSGGEAAAVSAGISAAGLGTDFGGSARWPAQCTGIIGLRPTVGRVPGSGQLPGAGPSGPWPPNPRTLQGRVQVIGSLARSADDLEMILTTIAGPDDLDPFAVPVPLGDSENVDLGTIELAWGGSVGAARVDEDISRAVADAASVLGSHMARTWAGLPTALDHSHEIYTALRESDPLVELRDNVVGNESVLTEGIASLLGRSPRASEASLAMLWAERDRLRRDLLTWLRGNRMLLLPVSAVPPFVAGSVPRDADGSILAEANVVAPCRLISLFGLPAMSIPWTVTSGGAPISVQLVAPPFREDLLFAAARRMSPHVSKDAGLNGVSTRHPSAAERTARRLP